MKMCVLCATLLRIYIASQGESIEDARKNLCEALELFFETASSEKSRTRLHKVVSIRDPHGDCKADKLK